MQGHFPEDPNRETYEMTKTTRARCKNRLERRRDGLELPKTFGSATDHKVLSKENASMQRRLTGVVRDLFSYWMPISPVTKKDLATRRKILQRFMLLSVEPGIIYTDTFSQGHSFLRRVGLKPRHFDSVTHGITR